MELAGSALKGFICSVNRLVFLLRLCAPVLGLISLSNQLAHAQETPEPGALPTENATADPPPSEVTNGSAESTEPAEPAEPASSAAFPVVSEEAPQVPVEPAPVAVAAPVPALAPQSTAEVVPPAAQAESPSTDTQSPTTNTNEKKDPEKRIRFYFGGRIAAVFGLHSTHQWKDKCPDLSGAGLTEKPTCSAHAPIGGAIDGHLGIRGKYFGSEGFILGSADYSMAKVNVQSSYAIPDFAEGMHIGRAGAGAGVSFRGFYDTKVVGFNAAVGGGFLWRSVFSSLSSLSGQSEQYVAPIFRFDAGLSLFKFLTAGLLGWVEFSKDVVLHPDLSTLGAGNAAADVFGDVTVFRGSQFFLGPYIGIRMN